MMREVCCPDCGVPMRRTMTNGRAVYDCPACAGESAAPSPLMRRLSRERSPKKRYAILQAALRDDPDSFEANRECLFHGRLHEPMRGPKPDFSMIKCHLLRVLDTPERYTPQALSAEYDELLRGEQLLRTLALAPDREAFYSEYIGRLAREYVALFIKGDSRNVTVAFGFARSPESLAKVCAVPVRRMLRNVAETPRLSDADRPVFDRVLREAFADAFPGHLDKIK